MAYSSYKNNGIFGWKTARTVRYANIHSHLISLFDRFNDSFLLSVVVVAAETNGMLHAECTWSADKSRVSLIYKNHEDTIFNRFDIEIRPIKKPCIESWWFRLLSLPMQFGFFISELFVFFIRVLVWLKMSPSVVH